MIIIVEFLVLAAFQRIGIKVPQKLAKCVGYAWVLLWLNTSLPWLMDQPLQAGARSAGSFPLSITKTYLIKDFSIY